jgi:hypothetical protein
MASIIIFFNNESLLAAKEYSTEREDSINFLKELSKIRDEDLYSEKSLIFAPFKNDFYLHINYGDSSSSRIIFS